MAEFLALRGSAAFSASRLTRLQKSLAEIDSGGGLAGAEHWYFVELDAPLNAGEMDRLKDLLGIPATLPASPEGNCCWLRRAWARFRPGVRRPPTLQELRLRRGEAHRARGCLSCRRKV
jgi:hypothetical protein